MFLFCTGRIGVWRPLGERLNPFYVKPMRRSGRVTQNYCGWMSYHGRGQLCLLTRKMNAKIYVRILQRHLLPDIQQRWPDNHPVYIIEDNSPVHTARIVTEWYNRHPRLVRLPHPPRSPDLNPIENMWARMTQNWHGEVAHNINELHARVAQSWASLGNEPRLFRSLMESMPKRFQAVIDNNGLYINY